VRDDHDAALKAVDPVDQRVDRLDVEVVCWLVEQEHVRPHLALSSWLTTLHSDP